MHFKETVSILSLKYELNPIKKWQIVKISIGDLGGKLREL